MTNIFKFQFDPKTKYKNKPVILEGGYEEWLARYPICTTNSGVSPPKREGQIRRISSQIKNFSSIGTWNYKAPSLYRFFAIIVIIIFLFAGDITYPTNAILEPKMPVIRQITPIEPDVPQPENATKPSIDRSTKVLRL